MSIVHELCLGSVPELANLGGKQHPMDIVFPFFPSSFTVDFPLSQLIHWKYNHLQ